MAAVNTGRASCLDFKLLKFYFQNDLFNCFVFSRYSEVLKCAKFYFHSMTE